MIEGTSHPLGRPYSQYAPSKTQPEFGPFMQVAWDPVLTAPCSRRIEIFSLNAESLRCLLILAAAYCPAGMVTDIELGCCIEPREPWFGIMVSADSHKSCERTKHIELADVQVTSLCLSHAISGTHQLQPNSPLCRLLPKLGIQFALKVHALARRSVGKYPPKALVLLFRTRRAGQSGAIQSGRGPFDRSGA